MSRRESDAFISVLNDVVARGESQATLDLEHEIDRVTDPVLFIVGPSRSGTTVLLQWLAASPQIAAPSNLLARLHRNPYAGGLLQRLLSEPSLGYGQELLVGDHHLEATSALGKTVGVMAPHELAYFWRDYFPLVLPSRLSTAQWGASDTSGFVSALARLQLGLGSAVAMKCFMLQYNIRQLADLVPRAIFVASQRDEVENVESLLAARLMPENSPHWFGVQPPGWESTLHLSLLSQVCAQVAWTNDDIAGQFESLPADRRLRVIHEDFSRQPADVWADFRATLVARGYTLSVQPPDVVVHSRDARSKRRREIDDELARMRELRPRESRMLLAGN